MWRNVGALSFVEQQELARERWHSLSLEQELVRHSVEVCNKLRVNLRAFIWKLWSNSMHCGNEGKNDERVTKSARGVVLVTAARPNER